jgi:hypothetical protein
LRSSALAATHSAVPSASAVMRMSAESLAIVSVAYEVS